MALQPIARQSIPDEIFSQLAAQVLTGDRIPGDTLPSERALAEASECRAPRSARHSGAWNVRG